jgi:hypothetical protein
LSGAKVIVVLSLLAAGVAAMLPNEFLMWHSYVLYALQFISMIPYLLKRARYVKNLFLPSFFVLVYFLVNFTLGGYLVPRGYGFNKEFEAVSLGIQHYNVIVPFFLLSHLVLFLLASWGFGILSTEPYQAAKDDRHLGLDLGGMGRTAAYFVTFFAVTYLNVYSAFSFQLALLILQCSDKSFRNSWYRFPVIALYLAVLVAFSYENKREIVMSLFLFIFMEAYYKRTRLSLTVKTLFAGTTLAVVFLVLVMAASILRGYGNFAAISLTDAFRYIPMYMTSEIFVDGITDNLELNYNYGVSITSVDHVLSSLIPYQYGASLIKVLFLPIPRDAVSFKPDSMMQLFTKVYKPEWWDHEGSMPVIFSSDMFMNFHFFGLLPYAIVWIFIDKAFLLFHTTHPRSFVFCSCAFLFITILMFARGSGLEQWLLYYLLTVPFFIVLKLLGRSVAVGVTERTRWTV